MIKFRVSKFIKNLVENLKKLLRLGSLSVIRRLIEGRSLQRNGICVEFNKGTVSRI